MSEQKDLSGDKATSGGGFNINPIDIVMYLLSNWYWFILSVSLFGGYAWYQYAKLPFIYSRSATVMIKDAYSNNIGRGLDRFNTYSYTNVSNETTIFPTGDWIVSPRLAVSVIPVASVEKSDNRTCFLFRVLTVRLKSRWSSSSGNETLTGACV